MSEAFDYKHQPVLLEPALASLAVHPDGVYVDCTLGGGGHSAAILARLGRGGRLIALDRDSEALAAGKSRLDAMRSEAAWQVVQGNFADLADILKQMGIARVHGILADLGVTCSSGQGPTGSTDVGNVSYRCPAIQPELAITPLPLSFHTHEFAEATMSPTGHEAIFLGSRALARMGLRVLMDAKLREAMHQDFLSARKEG